MATSAQSSGTTKPARASAKRRRNRLPVSSSSTVTKRIPLPELHPTQRRVMSTSARFKVLACGRRWGKTTLGIETAIDIALRSGIVWWISPSYRMAALVWRELKQILVEAHTEKNEIEHYLELPTGGSITVRSADNPDSLRGAGLDYVILDECALIAEDAWQAALRPALADRNGGALLISTPKGHNWFWRLYHSDEVVAYQFPTRDNPFIPAGEIEAAQRSLPERVFAQEFEAQFIDDAGGVFRHVVEAATGHEQDRIDGHTYIAGVDVAQAVDFTVCSVVDVMTKQQVYQDRFNRVDFSVLEDRLTATYQRYSLTTMIVESNSIGQPVIENLIRRGLNITSFATTSATKDAIVRQLQSAFEHGDIRILNDSVLVNELQAFESQRSTSGLFRYSAPAGMHDDCVMALALAWSGVQNAGPLIAFALEW